MCDRANSNTGCEIVDELEDTIVNYEDEIKELKSEIETKDMEIQELRKVYPYPYGSSGK